VTKAKRHLTPLNVMAYLCALLMLGAVLNFVAGDYRNADRASYAALAVAVGFVLGCAHKDYRGPRS
jgi:hypothetical protein